MKALGRQHVLSRDKSPKAGGLTSLLEEDTIVNSVVKAVGLATETTSASQVHIEVFHSILRIKRAVERGLVRCCKFINGPTREVRVRCFKTMESRALAALPGNRSTPGLTYPEKELLRTAPPEAEL